jgi:hypothetical protein
MKECYFCGKKANSKEHIPPKQMFKGFNINRMTVPSCNDHNTNKSGEDESIIKAMLMAIEKSKNNNLNQEMLIALDEVKGHYEQVKKKVTEEKVYVDYDKEIVCLDVSIKLDHWIKELSAGMIHYKIKCFDVNNKYDDSKVVERNSYSKNIAYLKDFEKERNEKIKLQKLIEIGIWCDGWIPKNGYPENLYFFKYKFRNSSIIIKHIFYKSFVYYNLIEISDESKKILSS